MEEIPLLGCVPPFEEFFFRCTGYSTAYNFLINGIFLFMPCLKMSLSTLAVFNKHKIHNNIQSYWCEVITRHPPQLIGLNPPLMPKRELKTLNFDATKIQLRCNLYEYQMQLECNLDAI